jgi:hypothetical protein
MAAKAAEAAEATEAAEAARASRAAKAARVPAETEEEGAASSVARSLQEFTAIPSKNHGHLGTFHGHQIFFYHCHIHSHISGFNSCHFYSFYSHIDPAVDGVLAVEVVPSLACVPCLKLAFGISWCLTA